MSKIDLEELRVHVALGTVDDNIRAELWQMDNIEALKILCDCNDLQVRKAIAINLHAPYSVLKKMMKDILEIILCTKT